MKIFLKNKYEIENMRKSGKITADVLEMIKSYIVPGISTFEIDQICHNYITKKKAIPACLGYKNFPKSTCISINDTVCHGIPNKKTILKIGDIVNIDVSIIKNNYYTDSSKMFFVGKVSKKHKLLCKVAQNSLYNVLLYLKPGIKINVIGQKIQEYVKKYNFSIVKEYCGHGVGKKLHELPYILHYKNHESNMILRKGMSFTIEPIINENSSNVENIHEDPWTIKTIDGGYSAQYEHTILITKNGCEILTHHKNESIPKFFINK